MQQLEIEYPSEADEAGASPGPDIEEGSAPDFTAPEHAPDVPAWAEGPLQTSSPVKPGELPAVLPTSTVHQARLQLYQPTRRPQLCERIVTGPWGKATVRGKIGQVHADIIEAMCRHAEDHRVVPGTGHLQILVDPYKVRVSVGGGKAYSSDTLWKMMRELRETSVTLEVPAQKLKVLGGILDRVEEAGMQRFNPLTKEKRAMWRVTFDPAFAIMLRDDLKLHYDPAPLAKIDSGVVQAIARHVLTHRSSPKGGWLLDTLIELVGAGGESSVMRNRRREVRAGAAQLQALGICLQGDRVLTQDDEI